MKQLNEQEILTKLVGINSVFPGEQKAAIFIEDYLRDLGFKVFRHNISKNRWNIFAERGNDQKPILFYGHMDTVPDYGKWSTDPFELAHDGDKLYGLGACDMKGGIAAILSALNNLDPQRKIKLLFGVDEENISKGAWSVVEDQREWFSDVELILVGEPGASAAQTGGVNVVTLGRRGRVVFEIEVFGKSAHGAHPEKGINAITEASKIAIEIEKMKLPVNKFLGPATQFVRKIHGESTSLSIPDKAIIEVDRHLVQPETIYTAKKDLEDLIDQMYKSNRLSKDADARVNISILKRLTPYAQPYITDENHSSVKNIIDIIKNNFSENVMINYGKSVADDNIFADSLNIPVVTIGPMGGNIHSSNEWVSAKSLRDVAKLYKLIINSKSKKSPF